MNIARHQSLIGPNSSFAGPRAAIALMVFGAALAASSPATAFDACANLTAMQGILGECFSRASRRAPKQAALRDAFSCYYSGNFLTGHQHGYVGKVLAAWSSKPLSFAPTTASVNPGASQ